MSGQKSKIDFNGWLLNVDQMRVGQECQQITANIHQKLHSIRKFGYLTEQIKVLRTNLQPKSFDQQRSIVRLFALLSVEECLDHVSSFVNVEGQIVGQKTNESKLLQRLSLIIEFDQLMGVLLLSLLKSKMKIRTETYNQNLHK